MRDALRMLQQRGYAPRVIVDGGANVGQWATIARGAFPSATLHLIEPQENCVRVLRARFPAPHRIHPVALSSPGIQRVRMLTDAQSGTSTGSHVTQHAPSGDERIVDCPAATLDALCADTVSPADRALLKLDLEGHEIEALRGATKLLSSVEVIVSETTFYDLDRSGIPLFSELLRTLEAAEYVLYDFAALYPRPRDQRLRMGDVVFVRRDSPLLDDVAWA